jgi:hypothetical protein
VCFLPLERRKRGVHVLEEISEEAGGSRSCVRSWVTTWILGPDVRVVEPRLFCCGNCTRTISESKM